MKKIIVIFLIVLGLSAYNITQASAGCNIVWTGDLSGSVPTNETSRTQQAAQELFNHIPGLCYICYLKVPSPSFIDGCYGYSGMGGRCAFSKLVCTSGTWKSSCESGLCDDFPNLCSFYIGNWDVVCDTTTTTIQQTTTTTTSVPPTTTTTAPVTLINLSSFSATPKFSKVIIQWNTESEIDNAGFNLYRSETEDGEYIKINTSLIPAQGSSTEGASYEFIDNNVQNRKTYYYKLEDIDLGGNSTLHGPVSATPRLLFRFFK